MTASQIIKKFETYVDDGTELSLSDELDLLNKVYSDVWTDRPWEFSKKAFSSSINAVAIALPNDFAYIAPQSVVEETADKLVWIDGKYYVVVNYSARYLYDGKEGYCWINMSNFTLEFSTVVTGTLKLDYICFPETLTLSDTPVFPAQFHDVIYHLMAVDDYAIQQFDKAKSYAGENKAKADHWLQKMRYWNACLITN